MAGGVAWFTVPETDKQSTAAVGIGLFTPPLGVGLLMAHARTDWPYMIALLVGLMLIICIPEPSLFLPRSAGLIK